MNHNFALECTERVAFIGDGTILYVVQRYWLKSVIDSRFLCWSWMHDIEKGVKTCSGLNEGSERMKKVKGFLFHLSNETREPLTAWLWLIALDSLSKASPLFLLSLSLVVWQVEFPFYDRIEAERWCMSTSAVVNLPIYLTFSISNWFWFHFFFTLIFILILNLK